jgi:hypothetical protein
MVRTLYNADRQFCHPSPDSLEGKQSGKPQGHGFLNQILIPVPSVSEQWTRKVQQYFMYTAGRESPSTRQEVTKVKSKPSRRWY